MDGAGTVIVGGGQAAVEVASALRANGYDRPIRIVSNEAHLPYQRPPLSKTYLSGAREAASLMLRSPAFFLEKKIEVLLRQSAGNIRRNSRELVLASGQTLRYEALVLATGASNRELPLAGARSPNVFSLRSLSDADSLQRYIRPGLRWLVIGGGFVGLEVAATARQGGAGVSIVEAAPALLSRATGAITSAHIAKLHRDAGSEVITGTTVSALVHDQGRAVAALLRDGRTSECDVIFYGIGASANTQLAAQAGLEVERGILVDTSMRTNDPHIFAVGDCAEHIDSRSMRRCRLESVQNAIDQAGVAARGILGEAAQYTALPWFWSDQFKTKLQIAGIGAGYTREVLRPGTDDASFSVFYFSASDQLLAVDSVNAPGEHMLARKLLSSSTPVPTHMVADGSVDLRSLL